MPCDENTDPKNMGTYNYAGPSDASNHTILDVLTYYTYGNVPGVKPTIIPDNAMKYNYVDYIPEASIPGLEREANDARLYRRNFLTKWTGEGNE